MIRPDRNRKGKACSSPVLTCRTRSTVLRLLTVIVGLTTCSTVIEAAQLKWSTGATDISVTTTRRCTLQVRMPAGQTLPAEWHLLWVAQSTSLTPTVFHTGSGIGDTLSVCTLLPPRNASEAAAGEQTAHFCATTGSTPVVTDYPVDLLASAKVQFMAVGFMPTGGDSTTFTVIKSSIATANGGPSASFPPVIHRAYRSHSGGIYRVKVAGSGLLGVTSATLVPANQSWRQPLNILSQTDSTVLASAGVEASLESCMIELTVNGAPSCTWVMPADTIPTPLALDPLSDGAKLFTPGGTIIPKDFAFFYDNADTNIHLFYIRHDAFLPADSTEVDLGHAVLPTSSSSSLNFSNWTQLPNVMHGKIGYFDVGHVWAPSIIQNGPHFYMFYTGVDSLGHQRIGMAWTDTLRTLSWHRSQWAVWEARMCTWCSTDSTNALHDGYQFRDPFVIADPDSSGNWIMYYSTVPKYDPGHYTIGIAKSHGSDFTKWYDYGPMHALDDSVTSDVIEESPHVFLSHGRWRLLFTDRAAGTHAIEYVEHVPSDSFVDLVDTVYTRNAAHWNARHRMVASSSEYIPLADTASMSGLEGTEYLKIGDAEYLAGYEGFGGASIAFNQLFWRGTSPDSFTVESPSLASVGPWPRMRALPAGARLWLADLRVGSGSARFGISLPSRMHARLEVFDAFGRRIRVLLDEDLPAGESIVRWDGQARGRRVRSNMYFARLFTSAGQGVVRVPLVH
jgi:hypothetical protein